MGSWLPYGILVPVVLAQEIILEDATVMTCLTSVMSLHMIMKHNVPTICRFNFLCDVKLSYLLNSRSEGKNRARHRFLGKPG